MAQHRRINGFLSAHPDINLVRFREDLVQQTHLCRLLGQRSVTRALVDTDCICPVIGALHTCNLQSPLFVFDVSQKGRRDSQRFAVASNCLGRPLPLPGVGNCREWHTLLLDLAIVELDLFHYNVTAILVASLVAGELEYAYG